MPGIIEVATRDDPRRVDIDKRVGFNATHVYSLGGKVTIFEKVLVLVVV